MAVDKLAENTYTALDSDNKPIAVKKGSVLIITDTGEKLRYNGKSWKSFGFLSGVGDFRYNVFEGSTVDPYTIQKNDTVVRLLGNAVADTTVLIPGRHYLVENISGGDIDIEDEDSTVISTVGTGVAVFVYTDGSNIFVPSV